MDIFTLIAVSLLSKPGNMANPCSVNAYGIFRVPPHLEIPFWNIKSVLSFSNSS